MTAKPGILHDPLQDFAQVLSETDTGAVRELLIEPVTVVGQAEASVVSDGADATLLTGGMSVKTIAGGPLVDHHNDYRHPLNFKEPYDSCARFAVKDNSESPAVWKSRDEYWSAHEFDLISTDADYFPYHDAHYDGQTLYHAVIRQPVGTVGFFAAVFVAIKNDSDNSWGSYAQVTDAETLSFSGNLISLCPTFLTIPGIGTLLLYYGFETANTGGYQLQVVKMQLTRDHGQTWENYGSVPIEPYYGAVNMTGAVRPYAYRTYAVLKATYYNNRIIVGMMLSGCETTTIDPGKYNVSRILNLMFSSDMGKSWSVVPYEFISSSIRGQIPSTDYNLGEVSISSKTYKAPASFALGVEPESDRAILVFHPAADIRATSPYKAWEWENIGGLVAYYNVSDDLYEWEHSYAGPRCFHLLDSFDVDRLANDYLIYGPDGTSNWYIAGGKLNQDAIYSGSGYPAVRAYRSTQAILLTDDDPTANAIIGIRCKISCTTVNPTYNADVGIGYARVDNLNFRVINIDCRYNSDSSGGYVTVTSRWISAGVETIRATATNIPMPAGTEVDVTILFRGEDITSVFIDGQHVLDDSTPATRNPGGIFLYCNKNDPNAANAIVTFDDLGLMIGDAYDAFPGTYLPSQITTSLCKIGQNMDVVVDDNNHAWISADTSNACLWDDGIDNETHFMHGIVLSRIRLARDVERQENKPLAKEKLVLKFELEGQNSSDVASAFNVFERGIFVVNVNQPVIGNTGPFLDRFVWHKTGPMFFVKRMHSTQEMTGVIRRSPYSNINVSPKFVSMYHPLTNRIDPLWSGWDYSGSFAEGTDPTILRVATDCTGYFRQEYDYSSDIMEPIGGGATALSCAIKLLDNEKRGFIAYFRTRSYASNSSGAVKTIFQALVPNLQHTADIALRLRSYDNTGYELQRWDDTAGNWVYITTLAADTMLWRDFLIFVVPQEVSSSGNPELTACHKLDTESNWHIIGASGFQLPPQTANDATQMKFGCFDGTGTVCQQEFKIAAYTDSCLVDVKNFLLHGEPTESGEAIELTQNVAVAFASGQPATNDEWLITAVEARSKPAANVLDRTGVLWRSDDDDTDKQIVLDRGLKHDFDTIVLVGANCQQIRIEANTQNNWAGPPFSVTLDLTQYPDVPYVTTAGKNWLLQHTYASNDWIKDALVGRRFVCEDLTYGAFRVRSNVDGYIWYESDVGPSIPTVLAPKLINILSDRIAVRLFERKQYQFFRLTFFNSGLSYPTPEGYFQLGSFCVGMFSEFMEYPQYPETVPRVRPVDQIRLASGAPRTLKRGARLRERTLNFDGVRNSNNGLKAQLELLHRDSQGRRPVYYVSQIDRHVLAGVGTYDFEVQPCTLSAPFKQSINGGWLTSVRLIMSDSR